MAPHLTEGWINLARMSEQLYLLDDAWTYYLKALNQVKTESRKALIHTNIGALAITGGDWGSAEQYSRLALKANPENRKAHGNLGTSLLAQRRWKEAWPHYAYILGSPQRKLVKYAAEPEWKGEKGKTVVLYGEQGLGDELCFASMIPDAEKDCGRLILDCDDRLAPLFRRSFPKAKVYGTRWKNELQWDKGDRNPDYSLTMGGLGALYRNADTDFPGMPYLKADPARVAIWRAYFATIKKPVIGIAWSGGVQWTAAQFRKWKPADFLPFMQAIDAHWVSLQYKDASADIAESPYPVQQYKAATVTDDYDDTAALVASCDLVICMQTAVAHLAGALGVPCLVFIPKTGQWRYGQKTDTKTPWYNSVQVFHERGGWEQPKAQAVAAMMKVLA